jgi:hypothetical protein
MIFRSTTDPTKLDVFVDGKQVHAGARSIRSNHFLLMAGGKFAFVAIEGDKRSVVSHLGPGASYEDLSNIILLPDGRPAYIGTSGGEATIHVGSWSAKIPAEHVHFLATFRLEAGQLRVLGTRGKEAVDFTVAPG